MAKNEIIIKKCYKCGKIKKIIEFCQGLNKCKECKSIEAKKYYEKNKDKIAKKSKKYYDKNKDKILEQAKKYRKENKEKKAESDRKYQEKNKDKIAAKSKEYRKQNKNKIIERQKKHYDENRDKILEKARKYRKENKEKRAEYLKKRKQYDPAFKLKYNVSGIIRNMILKHNGNKRGKSTSKYLEFTFVELKQHLEKQFEPWMNWDNYGKYDSKTWDDNDVSTWTWQIDHIIPHANFSYDAMEHPNFKKAWNLDNLRPYSAKQNVLDEVKRTRHKKNN